MTLSTFDEIITRFVEHRRLSRKKLPISYLGGSDAAVSLILVYLFFFLFKRNYAATCNLPFLYFSLPSDVPIQLFQTCTITRDTKTNLGREHDSQNFIDNRDRWYYSFAGFQMKISF